MAATDYSFRVKDAVIGAQMLLVAFGSLVLVPLLTGLSSNVALFTAGIGTLIFQVITRGKVPIFLASSFAFIAPICFGIKTWGLPATMGGLIMVGVVYMVVSLLVYLRGVNFILKIFPPIVTGSVIMVIGLILVPTGVNMATGGDTIPKGTALVISMSALATTCVVSLFGKGLLRLLPVICGIIVGWIVAFFMGVGDFSPIAAAPWLAMPDFTAPVFSAAPILFFIPVALAPAIEHFGDIMAISSVTGKNYLEDPGIHRTILGDGIATMAACLFAGPPNTTYSEVTGAVALTRSFNPGVMTWAAIAAILLSFVAKLGAVLSCIPTPVMGGIMILLFGTITVVGLNTLVQAHLDLMAPRNLIIVTLTLIFGISGISFGVGDFQLNGIGLAAIVGVILNILLPEKKKV